MITLTQHLMRYGKLILMFTPFLIAFYGLPKLKGFHRFLDKDWKFLTWQYLSLIPAFYIMYKEVAHVL